MAGELEGSPCDFLENWPLLRELRSLGTSLCTERCEVLFAVESLGFVAVAADTAGVPAVLKASLRTLDPESACGLSAHEDEFSLVSSSSFDLFERGSATSSANSICSSAFTSRKGGGKTPELGRQSPQLRRENVERLLAQPCVVGLHLHETLPPQPPSPSNNNPTCCARHEARLAHPSSRCGLGGEADASQLGRRVEVQASLWPK